MVKVLMMGEEIDIEEVSAPGPAEPAHLFAEVKLSPKAIDSVSRIVHQKHYETEGVYTFLKKRADFVFSKMTATQTGGRLRGLDYFFEYDVDGPVLKDVKLAE